MHERVRMFRRLVRRTPEKTKPTYKSKGTMGLVPPGTSGIYDSNPNVRSATARAMVARRQTVEVTCEVPHCDRDPETHGPKTFTSRLVNGRAERRGCCSAHRLWLWRKEMKDKGFKQVTVDGQIGWLTPENVFYPNPSAARRMTQTTPNAQADKANRTARRFRKVRRFQRRITQDRAEQMERMTAEVTPESE